jgi:histidinol-phosphate aminotransferase
MATFDIPEYISRLKPYVPGKPIEELERELGLTDIIKLASNESPLGPSPKAIAAIRETASNAHFYLEGSAPVLRAAVAEHLDVDPSLLVFGNGSDEVLLLLTTTLIDGPSDEIIIGDPSFAMYEIYATMANATLIKVPLNDQTHDLAAMADCITDRTKLIFIANPNNPTGTLVEQPEIDAFIARVPDTVTVVFDEAYDEFVDQSKRPSTLPYVLRGRNVVVTRTFSKAYALAGLRVGYGIAPKELASYLDRVRSPFNVNLIAQAAATAALADKAHLAQSVAVNTWGRKQLEGGATKLGMPFVPSQANFVMIDVSPSGHTGLAVYNALLREGVIVRPCAGFGLPNFIRVSVGTSEQIDRFLAALARVTRSE